MANRILVDKEENIEEPAWISRIEPFLLEVMAELSYDREEVSVFFCSDAFIQNLNKEYRNIDGPTDVLSFEDGTEYTDDQGEKWVSEGDIVISLETLPKNAEYFEVSCNEELKRLLVHGLLHLHGLDHGEEHVEKDSEPVCEMLKIQKRIMQKFDSTVIYE
ncbi:MAG: rRNA maturation RNase YbeY [Treponema sp.]|nr:rRNA maturation RNase YbeY [Treponema sp.]